MFIFSAVTHSKLETLLFKPLLSHDLTHGLLSDLNKEFSIDGPKIFGNSIFADCNSFNAFALLYLALVHVVYYRYRHF